MAAYGRVRKLALTKLGYSFSSRRKIVPSDRAFGTNRDGHTVLLSQIGECRSRIAAVAFIEMACPYDRLLGSPAPLRATFRWVIETLLE